MCSCLALIPITVAMFICLHVTMSSPHACTDVQAHWQHQHLNHVWAIANRIMRVYDVSPGLPSHLRFGCPFGCTEPKLESWQVPPHILESHFSELLEWVQEESNAGPPPALGVQAPAPQPPGSQQQAITTAIATGSTSLHPDQVQHVRSSRSIPVNSLVALSAAAAAGAGQVSPGGKGAVPPANVTWPAGVMAMLAEVYNISGMLQDIRSAVDGISQQVYKHVTLQDLRNLLVTIQPQLQGLASGMHELAHSHAATREAVLATADMTGQAVTTMQPKIHNMAAVLEDLTTAHTATLAAVRSSLQSLPAALSPREAASAVQLSIPNHPGWLSSVPTSPATQPPAQPTTSWTPLPASPGPSQQHQHQHQLSPHDSLQLQHSGPQQQHPTTKHHPGALGLQELGSTRVTGGGADGTRPDDLAAEGSKRSLVSTQGGSLLESIMSSDLAEAISVIQARLAVLMGPGSRGTSVAGTESIASLPTGGAGAGGAQAAESRASHSFDDLVLSELSEAVKVLQMHLAGVANAGQRAVASSNGALLQMSGLAGLQPQHHASQLQPQLSQQQPQDVTVARQAVMAAEAGPKAQPSRQQHEEDEPVVPSAVLPSAAGTDAAGAPVPHHVAFDLAKTSIVKQWQLNSSGGGSSAGDRVPSLWQSAATLSPEHGGSLFAFIFHTICSSKLW